MKTVRTIYLLSIAGILVFWLFGTLDTKASAATQEQAERLIVRVIAERTGGGIIFGRAGDSLLIATAQHVIGPGKNVKVEFKFRRGELRNAEFRFSDSGLDLAVLVVDVRGTNIPQSVPFDAIQYGSGVSAGLYVRPVGHPGIDWFVPLDPVKVNKDPIGEDIIFDYSCTDGHSGGGLFDTNWRLVGMITQAGGVYSIAKSFERIRETLVKAWGLNVALREVPIKDTGPVPTGLTPRIYSQGKMCITPNSPCDLDEGRWNAQAASDLLYSNVDGVERYLIPSGGAQVVYLGNVDFDKIDFQDLSKAKYTNEKINASKDHRNRLTSGAVFLVRTNQGRFSKVRVNRSGDYLNMNWVTYAKEGEGPLPSPSTISGPCSVEESMGCGTGRMSGDAILHFRIVNITGRMLTVDVDYTYHSSHGSQVFFGAYLLDADGDSLSQGFRPTPSPTRERGTVRMQVTADRSGHVESRDLFVWMYEAYKAEGFVCRRFPYSHYW